MHPGLSCPLADFEFGLEVLHLFNSDGHDIEYCYESRLINKDLPVEDFHFHPLKPQEFRLRIKYAF